MNNDTNKNLFQRFNNLPANTRLGIDIGRVLMCPTRDDGSADTSFLAAADDVALEIPPAPGMFDVVPRLVQRFDGRVWLVSKASPRIEALTRRWFDRHRFYDRTGIAPEAVRFCRRREEKRIHSDTLQLTHFIDDRADVLMHLRGGVDHLVLFGVQSEPIPDWVVHLPDWATLAEVIAPG